MNPAAATRLEKERAPERFCLVPRCLWRVKHENRPDTPCRKHPKVIDLMEALKKSLAATTAPPASTDETAGNRADRNYSGSDTSKITNASEVTK